MNSGNQWGGPLEILGDGDDGSADWDNNKPHPHDHLNDTQKSWLLEPTSSSKKKMMKKQYVDLGCVVCSRKALKLSLLSFFLAFFVIALPIILVKTLPKPKPRPLLPDNYTLALHKALLFFNAQKCKSSFLFFFFFLIK